MARAALAAAWHPNAAGKVFNVTDGEVHTLNDIIETICEALGRRPPRMHLPMGPIGFAADILDKSSKLFGLRYPKVRAALDKYTEDMAVDSHKIQSELGYIPKHDLFSGWKETIEEMRERGEI